MKIFSMFLPQFHEIEENNEWWGNGFTEWVNVKNAKPLFDGHVQPKHPVGENYYDLLEKDTMLWQTNLMKKNGISGMIYYHYYFTGKKLLEKPAENLLKWKDIDQPFFFCWANHTWNRSWNGTKEVLLEQTYGSEAEWRKHFEYLLPFFKDERYEKKNGKPLFMLYDCSIPEKKEMFSKFDDWCIEEGFSGIHIIEECFKMKSDYLEKMRKNKSSQTGHYYVTEPLAGRMEMIEEKSFLKKWWLKIQHKISEKGYGKGVIKYSGNEIYETLIHGQLKGDDIIPGIFFEWDNTPRHGKRGYIITPVDKEHFFKYMDSVKDSEYVIVNAWNEWAEGMMLEPTKQNGDRYLSWIKEWLNNN